MSALRGTRIVVRLPNWVGDAVMAIPAVSCVKRALPNCELTLLGKPSVIELYRYRADIDRILELRLPADKGKLSTLREFSIGLREYDFDLGITLPNSFSSALVFKMGNVKEIVGYRSDMRSFMLRRSLRLPREVIHRSRKYVELVSFAIGRDCPESDVSIPAPDGTTGRADALAAKLGCMAVICPTSRARSRRWGEEKYAQLACQLSTAMGFSVVLAGAPEEEIVLDRVGKASGVPFHNLARDGDILFSVEVMRRSEVFVGNDSGAAHLAAASGTRVVSISGADDPAETRPLARVARIVNKHVECSPCVKNVCPRKDHINLCMDVISVDEVLETVREILEIEG